MIVPKVPKNEKKRLEELRTYSILDSMPEKEYDEITYLASEICGTPVSMITLIDENRQWFKSHPGMPVNQSPREISFCAHAINDPTKMMIVPDTRKDKRFHDNPVVTGYPNVVFYAGVPLVSPKGYPLGTLCVGDNKPHTLNETQIRSLKALTNQLMKLLELRKKSMDLERKNKDILAGIQYAKKIQYSILPPKKEFRKDIPGLFVYFRPKDVIGGDFHWLYRKDNLLYVAAVDCTGHGVPGALMSMTIHSLLNEIMLEGNKAKPGDMLTELHKKIYLSLQQDKGDQYAQDGCDIALCAIDYNTNILHYAGARINLHFVKEETVHNIKATRRSIGGLSLSGKREVARIFETHEMNLDGVSLLVMTTDGIPEQLSKNNISFNAAKFQNMLLEMNTLSVMEMNHLVRNEVKDWLQQTVQQDDMLMIGLKLNQR